MSSLRFKIIAPFLLGFLTLTLFLSFHTYKSAQTAVTDAALLISRAQTESIYNSMSLLFRSMSTSAERMTTDSHVLALFAPAADGAETNPVMSENWLDILIHGNEYYRNIFIVDKDGVCIGSNSQMQVGISYASRPYIQTALAGEPVLSDFSIGSRTKTLSATVATPIYLDGEVVGAVVLVNDFPNIVHYDAAHSGGIQAVFSVLLAPDGRFVVHRDKNYVAESARYPELYAQLVKAGIPGDVVDYTLDGARYLGYAKLEPTTGWLIISSGIKSQLFSNADTLGLFVLVVSLAALFIIACVVIFVINGILGALLSLIAYAKQVSEGDLTVKLADSMRSDELGILQGALQVMVQSMREMLARAQEANKLKSEFLANMSHEIRTPLNAVIGMAHLYLASEDPPEKKREYIVKGQIAAKALLGIINDILDISKIEAGMFDLDRIFFDLRQVVEQVRLIHQEGAAAKGLTFDVHYAPATPEYFIGDPVRIGQVLNNLVSNAIKFSDKGCIRISCGHIPEQTDSAHALIRVTVQDSGMGMTPDQMVSLFSPFMQADASITRRFGGTGLGLAISDKIVRMMGGGFEVSSQPGEGSTFVFTLLLEIAAEEGEACDCAEADLSSAFRQLNLAGKSILVAEDNEINQLVIQDMLSPTGADIVLVENGQLAVDAVSERRFDIVFMDMQMPVMDGIQASRAIRALELGCHIPIVAVTANAMKEDKENGFAAGLNDYITKPIDAVHLFRVLKKWV